MSKPKILILSTAYLPMIGGSELAIHHIAERLTDFDFDVVTGRYDPLVPKMERIGRVRVFRVGGSLARFALFLPKILMPLAMAFTAARLIQKQRYTLTHAYQASQAGGAAWLLKFIFPRLPFVLTIQEGKELQHQSILIRTFRSLILRSADHITAISSYLATYVRRFSKAPIDLIPNGVSIRDFSRETSITTPHRAISVSRLVQKNNVENIIRAMAYVLPIVPDARLTIVGDGPLRRHLEGLASNLKLSKVVDFIGSVAPRELPEVLSGAGVFVRPSLSEGLGSAFLEAMAVRVPVVASAVGGIPDIVHDGETGLLCDPSDPTDIARQIIRLMTDIGLRDHIVKEAFRMVETNYDWDIIAQRMGRLYRSMITP